MLILSREVSEGVTLIFPDGTRVGVTIAAMRGNKTRLGFVAAPEVLILRDELVADYDAERAAQARADAATHLGGRPGPGGSERKGADHA